MKKIIAIGATIAASGCVAMPSSVPPGMFEPEAEFTVNLGETWSYWPGAHNGATRGGYLSQDGFMLNRIHMVSLKEGETLANVYIKDDVPKFSASSTEFEIVELVTNTLLKVGYNAMEADDIRPVEVDGQDGIAFSLSGKWENGLNVKGDAQAVVANDKLHLIFFLAPEIHYYNELEDNANSIFASMDLK